VVVRHDWGGFCPAGGCIQGDLWYLVALRAIIAVGFIVLGVFQLQATNARQR
jgi:hypothetical protein